VRRAGLKLTLDIFMGADAFQQDAENTGDELIGSCKMCLDELEEQVEGTAKPDYLDEQDLKIINDHAGSLDEIWFSLDPFPGTIGGRGGNKNGSLLFHRISPLRKLPK
jgi:hypothetical protein